MAFELQIFWNEYENIVIRDVPEKMRNRVAEFMTNKTFKENVIYNELQFQEEEGMNEWYYRFVLYTLRNDSSIIALDKTTNEIYGVGLLMWMTKEWHSWADVLAYMPDKGRVCDFITFRRNRILEYAAANPDHESDSLHVCKHWIHPDLCKNSEFLDKFFNSVSEVGRHVHMPRVTILAETGIEREQLEMVGFIQLSLTLYSTYLDKHKRRPYAKLRDIDEMGVALYEMPLEPILHYELMPVHEITVRRCSLDDDESPSHQKGDKGGTAPLMPSPSDD